jgi:hypothetical protein
MYRFLPFFVTAAALPGPSGQPAKNTTKPMKKMTPVLVVERIEPSLALWVDRLGFEKRIEVPEGDHLGFVGLTRGGIEIMYQTRESVRAEIASADLPEVLLPSKDSHTTLFCEVEDLDEIRRSLEGLEILLPYRKTTYGAEELWLREPGGHIIGFAQFPAP